MFYCIFIIDRAHKEAEVLPMYSLLRLCDQAGDAVADSINISSCKEHDSILQVCIFVYEKCCSGTEKAFSKSILNLAAILFVDFAL